MTIWDQGVHVYSEAKFVLCFLTTRDDRRKCMQSKQALEFMVILDRAATYVRHTMGTVLLILTDENMISSQ